MDWAALVSATVLGAAAALGAFAGGFAAAFFGFAVVVRPLAGCFATFDPFRPVARYLRKLENRPDRSDPQAVVMCLLSHDRRQWSRFASQSHQADQQ